MSLGALRSEATPNSQIEVLLKNTTQLKKDFPKISDKLLISLDYAYSFTNYSLIWSNNHKLNQFTYWINNSHKLGIDVDAMLKSFEADTSKKEEWVKSIYSDISYTLVYFKLYQTFYNGRIAEKDRGKTFYLPSFSIDTFQVLSNIATANDFSPFYTAFPQKKEFKTLLDKTIKFYDLKENANWNTIVKELDTIQLGIRNKNVIELKSKLNTLGFYKSQEKLRSPIFDSLLVHNLKNFQNSVQLDTTGILDSITLIEINKPLEERWKTMALNVERWLWFPKDFGSYHVVVNLPNFILRLYENDSIIHTQKAVIGRKDRSTPIFYSTMTYFDLNPTWSVPPNILANDIVPSAKKSSSYLSKKNIKVIDYSSGKVVIYSDINWSNYKKYGFVQDPGPSNSLGNVKFIFPNTHFIFFHDTPTKSHFALNDRAYSSGCIRLENALSLASVILRENPIYTEEKIDEIVKTRKTTRVVLKNPPQVFITYFTAEVQSNGILYFYKDVYGHDKSLAAKLSL